MSAESALQTFETRRAGG